MSIARTSVAVAGLSVIAAFARPQEASSNVDALRAADQQWERAFAAKDLEAEWRQVFRDIFKSDLPATK